MTLDATAEAPDVDFTGLDDDTASFLTDITGVERPKKEPEVTEEPDADADIQSEAGTELTEAAGDEKAATEPDTGDDPEVTFKIGDAEQKVRMSELRTLVERREALSKETEEVVAEKARYTETATKAMTALETMLARAQERWKPFAALDWVTARQRMEDDAWDNLRSMAQDAANDVQFLSQELDSTIKQRAQAFTQEVAKARQTAISELTKPADQGGIEGFGQPLYTEMVEYGTTQGLSRDEVLSVVSPAALKVLHKAMLYDRQQKAKAEAEQKVARASSPRPTNVARPAASGNPAKTGRADTNATAMARLRRTGSIDDATAAFLADLRDAD